MSFILSSMENYWEKQVIGMENYIEDMDMTETVETGAPTDAPIVVTAETMATRLAELQKNHANITQELEKLEAHKLQGAQTLLVLSGAIQVLEELSGQAPTTVPE
jgi:hypothetical protein